MNFNGNHASAPKRAPMADSMNDLRLSAARKRLAESKDKEDAIEGLREIVANLLGCEEIGLFEVDTGSDAFSVCWSFGADLDHYDLSHALGATGLQRVLQGDCHIDATDCDRSSGMAKAFVPIRVANQTIGILAILRLLPQKIAFDAHDMELFKLLSEEAANPLFGLNAHQASTPARPGMKP
jgi:GAF domain-containing protein